MATKTPVILDTDIGGDIDDAWALALILKSPELDLKMILTETGKPTYRGAVAGKYLQLAGRTEIPIGLGIHENNGTGPQEAWLGDYQLSDYPGEVWEDGIGAMIDMIMTSDEKVTLICIGPVPNLKKALEREPRIASKVRLVGMFGSIYMGYDGDPEICAETNVRLAPEACQLMFRSFPDCTITPLDTCGLVQLKGENYQKFLASTDPHITALRESYISWADHVPWTTVDPLEHSSILFDTVAVYLALSEAYLEIEPLGLQVTADGRTLIDPSEKPIRCAIKWKELPAFEDWLTSRLLADA